ncbi:unnamed protein product, partial [Cuscuta campestris]
MENGGGSLEDKFARLRMQDPGSTSGNKNDGLFQVIKAVEAAEITIKQQVEENNQLRFELQKKILELETYKSGGLRSENCHLPEQLDGYHHQLHGTFSHFENQTGLPNNTPRHTLSDNLVQNDLCSTLQEHGESSRDPDNANGILRVHFSGQNPPDPSSFFPSRYQKEGEQDRGLNAPGHGLMPISELNNPNSVKQILDQEQEILQLRNHLGEYLIKEAQICNEKCVLEKRIAYMRMAFDQQQQDLVDAASKAISYRQDIIEENIRLAYALQAAQQEKSTFVSSLLPLLEEYSLQPLEADAQSIVSNIKILFRHLQERLLSTEPSKNTLIIQFHLPFQTSFLDLPICTTVEVEVGLAPMVRLPEVEWRRIGDEEDGQPNPDRVEPDDIWMDDLVRYYMTGQFPEDEDRVRKVKLRAPRFQMLDGRLYKRAFGGPLLRCLTRAETERVIAEVHEGVCAAHQMSRTLAQRIILLGYFWPTMNQDCEMCKGARLARFGMDIIGAFPQAQGRKKYVMVAIDYFTKWVEAEAYATITTKQCQRFVWKNIITRFGSPRNIVTDNGPQFRNPGFTKYLEDFGITHNKASVAYPQGNGQVENVNRTIVDEIKKRFGEAGTNWLEELPHIIWAYRVTSRRATGETPFVLTYGCEARLPIEAKMMTFREKIYEEKGNEEDHLAELNLLEERRMVAEAKMIEYQQAAKAYHDNKVGPRYFQVGDEVLRRREASKPSGGGKLAKKWEGPYRVKAILRPGTYKLETTEGRELE